MIISKETTRLNCATKIKAASVLTNGGVVLIPTDTVIGLACLPTIDSAVNKIFRMKNRKRDFNLPIMVSSINQLHSLGLLVDDKALILLKSKYVPGPLTLVMGFQDEVERPEWLCSRHEVAVRLPDDELLLEIIDEVGPILMTSANLHQSKVLHNNELSILSEIEDYPDLVISGERRSFAASTIVNTKGGKFEIEREGAVSKTELFQLLEVNTCANIY